MAELNLAEERFAGYLDAHGYTWQHEPDYQAVLGLAERPLTKPDFMLQRNGQRAVAEVRQFESTRVDKLMAGQRVGTLSDRDLYGSVRSALREKAEQLLPFAGTGVPLLIVLANTKAVRVFLDDAHMPPAMWGNPGFVVPVDMSTGGPVGDQASYVKLEDYGAFTEPVMQDGRVAAWKPRHPHITAVVVVHERRHSDDWREEVMGRHKAADRSFDAAWEAAAAGMRDLEAAVARGEEPQGVYRSVTVYEVNGEQSVPLPSDWFGGLRDVRYGITENGYGRLWPELSE